jgi:hypothetical protein
MTSLAGVDWNGAFKVIMFAVIELVPSVKPPWLLVE